MEIKIKVDYINYGELVTILLPKLGGLSKDNGIKDKMLKAIASLPSGPTKAMVDALPQDTKDEIAAYLISKNKDNIIKAATQYAESNGVSITVSDIEVEA